MKTIKLDPPSWTYAARIYILALENGTGEGKEAARAEIMRMAELLDTHQLIAKEA